VFLPLRFPRFFHPNVFCCGRNSWRVRGVRSVIAKRERGFNIWQADFCRHETFALPVHQRRRTCFRPAAPLASTFPFPRRVAFHLASPKKKKNAFPVPQILCAWGCELRIAAGHHHPRPAVPSGLHIISIEKATPGHSSPFKAFFPRHNSVLGPSIC